MAVFRVGWSGLVLVFVLCRERRKGTQRLFFGVERGGGALLGGLVGEGLDVHEVCYGEGWASVLDF